MATLLDPAILFFVLGIVAGAARSNLEIPQPVARFLSLYLLMALGLKGGFSLAASGFTPEVFKSLLAALGLAVVVQLASYALLRRLLPPFDAAALAATYGSVSAVTFITATQHLAQTGVAYGGHMAAAMALMESPAIILAVLLANRARRLERGAAQATASPSIGGLLHESLTEGAQVILLGSLLIGLIAGPGGEAVMKPFVGDLFKGMLAFFLLDMGLRVARNAGQLRGQSPWLLGYAVLAPLVHALVALGLARALGLSQGDATLLMVLAASASYIAVPAVVSHAIPEARPSLYFGMSLGVTFPLNILLGIPFYAWLAARVL